MKAGVRTSLTHGILSFSAAGLSIQSFIQSGTAIRWPYIPVVFFSTWFIYRIAWYGLKWPFKPGSFSLLILIASMTGIAAFSVYLHIKELTGLLIMFVFCLVYFAEKGKWKGLRSVTFVKSMWVALVWTIVTAWIPLIFSLEKHELLITGERFLYMNAICLIYNLRDVKHDFSKGITTVPQRYGVFLTKTLALTLLLICAVIMIFHNYPVYILNALMISIAISVVVSLFAIPDGNWLYYTLAVDGSMLLQSCIVILFYVQN